MLHLRLTIPYHPDKRGQVLCDYCVSCSMNSEDSQFCWWEQVLILALCEHQTLSSQVLSGGAFPAWGVSSHACADSRLCWILKWRPCRSLGFSPCSASSICPMNSHCLGLPRLSALSPKLRKSAGLCLVSPFLFHGLETLSGQLAEEIIKLTSFVSHLSGVSVLIPNVSKAVLSFLVCFFFFSF